jgi:hypothetical protein
MPQFCWRTSKLADIQSHLIDVVVGGTADQRPQ